MNILKNRKEHPKTTKQGNKATLIVAVISLIATLLGSTQPEIAEVLKTHSYELASGVLGIIAVVQVIFSAKKDQ